MRPDGVVTLPVCGSCGGVLDPFTDEPTYPARIEIDFADRLDEFTCFDCTQEGKAYPLYATAQDVGEWESVADYFAAAIVNGVKRDYGLDLPGRGGDEDESNDL